MLDVNLKDKIVQYSEELDFDLIGFTPYQLLQKETSQLEIWLKNSYNSGMSYMERNKEKRRDVRQILNNCESVISLGINYHNNEEFDNIENSGKVSRYAWGKDYHNILWEKLDELINKIRLIEPAFEAKSYVDTGPVMDKVWAVKSGLGWQGKHSNIINKNIGSWFFIANIFTNYNFDSYDEVIVDHCGSCTACIDECPTSAIIQDYVVDSNKCISYLTIENKNEIPQEFVGKFDNWIFGCDICQDVCPWNIKFSVETRSEGFKIIKNKNLKFDEIFELSNSQFSKRFKESPILRSRAKGLKRNAKFLSSNES